MSLIKKQIKKYLQNKPLAFHSPAHCGTENINDLSELTGLDDLQYPNSVIKDSQDFVAGLFGAQKSFYLVNGASQGLQAALLSIKVSKPILLARNVHKSVISGIILAGHEIEFFEPEWLSDYGVYARFDLSDQIKSIEQNYSALVVSNPSYEGFYSELPKLTIPIIVDEAHGAHYHFSESLPKPALECGADIVIQSWHKTLGSLTQTGVLHVSQNSKISAGTVADNLRLVSSTSPSYLLLESLCSTAHRMKDAGTEIFSKALERAKKIDFVLAKNDDPLRALFKVKGFSGEVLDDFFEDAGIALESHSFNSALAFINYANTIEEIQKLNNVYQQASELKRESYSEIKLTPVFAKQSLKPRDAFFADSKDLDLEAGVGKVSAELYAPCPPGIAILVPGQIISKENILILKNSSPEKLSIKICR